LAFILCSALASAADYDITITPLKDTITLEQTAQFLVTIQVINSTKIEKFSVFSPEVEWSIPPDTIKVSPSAPESFKLLINPTKYIIPGPYGISINFRRESPEELVEKTVFVNVKTEAELKSSYKLSVKTDLDMPISISPDKRLTIRVTLENQNILNLTDLQIKIISDLDVLNTERTVSLAPLEEKVIEFTYELNPLQKPGEYRVSFDLLKENRTVETFSTRVLTVLEKKIPFKKQEQERLSFLKLTKELTFISESNIYDTQRVSIPIGVFEKWFTSSIPDGTLYKEEGKRFIGWDLGLAPGESKTIFVTVNYRPVFYIIILIAAAAALFFIFKSPVSIRKEVSEVSLKEGGISHIRIMLEVSNSSKKAVNNVHIIDYVPKIAEIEQTHIEGTLSPSKVLLHKEKGSILRWDLDELAPGEDRLLSYNIRSTLTILGSFKLPRAKVKFRHRKKEYVSYSNTLGISS
jgi:hypothetical protein